jgi:hypothetical protein
VFDLAAFVFDLAAGANLYKRRCKLNSMFTTIPGWNVDEHGNKLHHPTAEESDFSMVTLYKMVMTKRQKKSEEPAMEE